MDFGVFAFLSFSLGPAGACLGERRVLVAVTGYPRSGAPGPGRSFVTRATVTRASLDSEIINDQRDRDRDLQVIPGRVDRLSGKGSHKFSHACSLPSRGRSQTSSSARSTKAAPALPQAVWEGVAGVKLHRPPSEWCTEERRRPAAKKKRPLRARTLAETNEHSQNKGRRRTRRRRRGHACSWRMAHAAVQKAWPAAWHGSGRGGFYPRGTAKTA